MKRLLISSLAIATIVAFSSTGMAKPDLRQLANKTAAVSIPETVMTDEERAAAEQAENDALPEALQMVEESIGDEDVPIFPPSRYKGVAYAIGRPVSTERLNSTTSILSPGWSGLNPLPVYPDTIGINKLRAYSFKINSCKVYAVRFVVKTIAQGDNYANDRFYVCVDDLTLPQYPKVKSIWSPPVSCQESKAYSAKGHNSVGSGAPGITIQTWWMSKAGIDKLNEYIFNTPGTAAMTGNGSLLPGGTFPSKHWLTLVAQDDHTFCFDNFSYYPTMTVWYCTSPASH